MFELFETRLTVSLALVGLLALLGAARDVSTGKIDNWLTVGGGLCGLVLAAQKTLEAGSADFLIDSFLGLVLGFALFGWIFLARQMGAGDVKFLMALGALGGVNFVVSTALLSVLAGGVMAALQLTFKGRWMDFFLKLSGFVSSLRKGTLSAPGLDKTLRIPFGVSIAIAALWVAFQNPFFRFLPVGGLL